MLPLGLEALRLTNKTRQGGRKKDCQKVPIKSNQIQHKISKENKHHKSTEISADSPTSIKQRRKCTKPKHRRSDMDHSATFSISSEAIKKFKPKQHKRKTSSFAIAKVNVHNCSGKKNRNPRTKLTNKRVYMNKSMDLNQTAFNIFSSFFNQSQSPIKKPKFKSPSGDMVFNKMSTICPVALLNSFNGVNHHTRPNNSVSKDSQEDKNRAIIEDLKKENEILKGKIEILQSKLVDTDVIKSDLITQNRKIEQKQSRVEELQDRLRELKKKYNMKLKRKESHFISQINEYKTMQQILVPKYKDLCSKLEKLFEWKKRQSFKWGNLEKESIENKLRWVFNNDQEEMDKYLKEYRNVPVETENTATIPSDKKIHDVSMNLAQRPFEMNHF
ncbi:unnamed protein product [Moneuplotes crassus]|uniref:Uncharacterized protein n=1 Tax=Euplotes crassus TaxID=5936 RepID=A0AAD1UI57_EUPCR|nr:unnamed protein product [Moneuplotes crassus]